MSIDSARVGLASAPSCEALALLDDRQEWSAFSRLVSVGDDVWESNLLIEGMHCAACALTIEEALRKVPGVLSAQVGSASHRASIIWSAHQVRPSTWLQSVRAMGYRPVPANDVFEGERRRQETRQALWRWAVAGFCMMQVMMYAYPAYTAQPGDLTGEMEHLLRWASWLLSLPVMFFSCGPFFRNAWRDLIGFRISMDLPVAIGIAITFVVSTLGTFEPNGIFGKEVFFDSLTMFVFFLLTGRWLELRLRDRTAGAIDALLNRLPDSVERANELGQFERIASRRVVAGDLLRVHAGEAFVADGIIESGETLVDEAMLTGESTPLHRGPGGGVLSGSHNLSGTVLVRATAVGGATRFAQIVSLMNSAASSKPRSVMVVDRLAKPFLLAVMAAAALACAWWWPVDPGHALMVAVAVLIVTCPCALSLATPAALLAAAGALARQGVLVRNLQALDSLSSVTDAVFDKTGTLTHDNMRVGEVHTRSGFSVSQAIGMAAALAAHSLHPISKAVCRLATPETETWHASQVTEIPGKGIWGAVTQGTEHAAATRALRLGSAAFCEVPDQGGNSLCTYLRDASGWLARFDLTEELRVQAKTMVQTLQSRGLQVHLVSGDAGPSVAQIAALVGIDQVKAHCAPDEKLAYLRQLQSTGRQVLMAGDGLNDGPVLAGANVSFALGHAAALAQAKADFVILGDQIGAVGVAHGLAQRMRAVIGQNLGWALAYNAACVPLAVFGYLPAWLAGLGMAASSLLVVLNALRLSRIQ